MERRGRGRGLSGVPTLGAVGDAPSSSTSKRMGLRWSTMNICVAIGTLALVVVAIFNTGIVAVRYLLCARSSEREREKDESSVSVPPKRLPLHSFSLELERVRLQTCMQRVFKSRICSNGRG